MLAAVRLLRRAASTAAAGPRRSPLAAVHRTGMVATSAADCRRAVARGRLHLVADDSPQQVRENGGGAISAQHPPDKECRADPFVWRMLAEGGAVRAGGKTLLLGSRRLAPERSGSRPREPDADEVRRTSTMGASLQ